MKYAFLVTVMYTQVVVYLKHLDRPGLLWTDEHVAQGFAWDNGIVAFGVPDHDGECRVNIDTSCTKDFSPTNATLWAIKVPFVASESEVQVGTVLDDRTCDIALGQYSLVFEALPGPVIAGASLAFDLNLFFKLDESPDFRILKQGSLITDRVLTRQAQRA